MTNVQQGDYPHPNTRGVGSLSFRWGFFLNREIILSLILVADAVGAVGRDERR